MREMYQNISWLNSVCFKFYSNILIHQENEIKTLKKKIEKYCLKKC